MNRIITSIAATAALLVSGQVLAQQPLAGEAPFDHGAQTSHSSVQRAEVRLQAAQNMPATGELNSDNTAENLPSEHSRAEMRQATRDALKQGAEIATGEDS